MATHVSTSVAQTSSPLAGIMGLNQTDLEVIADEKGGDFLSLMLASLEEVDGKKGKHSLLDTILKSEEEIATLPLLKLDEELGALELQEATFVQLLQFLEHLNGGKEVKTFHKIDDKLNLLLKDASIFQEFKGAKNIKDIFELSKKYDLGLEKISISKQDLNAIKEAFPKLESRGFFKDFRTNITSSEILNASKNQPKKSLVEKKEVKSLTNTLSSILQNITKEKKSDKNLFVKDAKNSEIIENKEIKHNLKNSEIIENKEIKKDIKIVKNQDIKVENRETQEVKTKLHVKTQDDVKVAIKDDVKIHKNSQIQKEINTEKKSDIIDDKRQDKISNPNDEELKHKDKSKIKTKDMEPVLKQEETKEPTKKNEKIFVAENSQKVAPNDLTQKDRLTQNDSVKIQKNSSNGLRMQNYQESSSENKNESSEHKQDSNHNTSFAKEIGKADSLHVKSSSLKHTINTFAQEFKEKIEEYKPPIMKVKMTLNPKALGEMDVTIVNRGSNLHVSINSNVTAMNLFLQNQAEFKNSLVNMGFTNLEMNFSNQKQNQQQQNNKNGTTFASDLNEEDEQIAQNTLLEIVLPNYV